MSLCIERFSIPFFNRGADQKSLPLFFYCIVVTLMVKHQENVAWSRYTLFVIVRKKWWNYFFATREKKRSTHYSSWTAVFTNVCSNWKYREKSSLNSLKKPPTLANVLCKTLTNLTNHSLHIIRVSHEFCPFVPISSLFANSV